MVIVKATKDSEASDLVLARRHFRCQEPLTPPVPQVPEGKLPMSRNATRDSELRAHPDVTTRLRVGRKCRNGRQRQAITGRIAPHDSLHATGESLMRRAREWFRGAPRWYRWVAGGAVLIALGFAIDLRPQRLLPGHPARHPGISVVSPPMSADPLRLQPAAMCESRPRRPR